MANPEHVELLKSGVDKWNAWRKEDKVTRPDLFRADLSDANLNDANLFRAKLLEAKLLEAKLLEAKLLRANLSDANLNDAKLLGVDLRSANLRGASLSQADLRGADLRGANLRAARLDGAKLNDARCWDTLWSDINLTTCLGIDTIRHEGPSSLDHRTLHRSPDLPDAFLRGCGLSDLDIEHYRLMQPGLTNEQISDITYRMFDIRATQAIQINPLFISYTHKDSTFVDKLGTMLTKKGVRYWRDIHHATAGKLEKVVDRAMRLNPTVLIVLSKHAVNSDWVQHEVRKARKLEIKNQRDCLCPIALDDTWEMCRWPERLKEQLMEYNILDFSEWQNSTKLERQFGRLLQGLDLFYE